MFSDLAMSFLPPPRAGEEASLGTTGQDGVLDCEQTGDTGRGVANPVQAVAVEQRQAMDLEGVPSLRSTAVNSRWSLRNER